MPSHEMETIACQYREEILEARSLKEKEAQNHHMKNM